MTARTDAATAGGDGAAPTVGATTVDTPADTAAEQHGEPAATGDSLDTVRETLLRQAREEAARLVREASREADAAVAAADARVRSVVEDARARGEADGAALVAGERAAARRQAREVVLRARRDAYEMLRAQAGAALRKLADDPAVGLSDQLARRARSDLGPDAEITRHDGGDVTATAPGRRATYSLQSLADRAIADLGEVDQLWAP